MKRVITGDGSVTYYNEQIGDHYHTKSGAREEAVEKHVRALGVAPGRVVFDVFFGLGYNTAAALDVGPATVYCFENDLEILKKALSLDECDSGFRSFWIVREFLRGFFDGRDVYENAESGVKLVMLFGDARETIMDVPERADYVFFDPFSPARVPELWTREFFLAIRDKMSQGGKLSTYSCARWVRDNMRAAGFIVSDGPVLGRRGPSTICAVLNEP